MGKIREREESGTEGVRSRLEPLHAKKRPATEGEKSRSVQREYEVVEASNEQIVIEVEEVMSKDKDNEQRREVIVSPQPPEPKTSIGLTPVMLLIITVVLIVLLAGTILCKGPYCEHTYYLSAITVLSGMLSIFVILRRISKLDLEQS